MLPFSLSLIQIKPKYFYHLFFYLIFIALNLNFTFCIAQEQIGNEYIKQIISIASNNNDLGRMEKLNTLKRKLENLPKRVAEDHNKEMAKKNNQKGLNAYNSGKFRQAINFFLDANKLDPDDAEINYNLGHAYLKLDNLNNAYPSITRSLINSPNNISAWNDLAKYFSITNRLEKSIACYIAAFYMSEETGREEIRILLEKKMGYTNNKEEKTTINDALVSLLDDTSSNQSLSPESLEKKIVYTNIKEEKTTINNDALVSLPNEISSKQSISPESLEKKMVYTNNKEEKTTINNDALVSLLNETSSKESVSPESLEKKWFTQTTTEEKTTINNDALVLFINSTLLS
ncbi:tetratricopeptide repeat protein [Thiocystis minor]|uniref:tetratricopeptide repeat protein n=1 Tax=Thiocystis minor TaxID=61597 RepID=UPI00191126B4|nr:tetratricopeptide repeat protein [Thiocystis minor]